MDACEGSEGKTGLLKSSGKEGLSCVLFSRKTLENQCDGCDFAGAWQWLLKPAEPYRFFRKRLQTKSMLPGSLPLVATCVSGVSWMPTTELEGLEKGEVGGGALFCPSCRQ